MLWNIYCSHFVISPIIPPIIPDVPLTPPPTVPEDTIDDGRTFWEQWWWLVIILIVILFVALGFLIFYVMQGSSKLETTFPYIMTPSE